MRYKYSDKQEKQILKSIVILVDTREQKNSHITSWFDAKGVKWKSKKLDFGDYSFYIPANEEMDKPRDLMFTDEIAIERKAHLDELAGNLSERRQVEMDNPDYDTNEIESDSNKKYVKVNVDEIQRLSAELVRAQKSKAIFDVVIEISTDHPSSWLAIASDDYSTKYTPNSFAGRLFAFMARYNLNVGYAHDIVMGWYIYKRFNYYARERFGMVLMDELMDNFETNNED